MFNTITIRDDSSKLERNGDELKRIYNKPIVITIKSIDNIKAEIDKVKFTYPAIIIFSSVDDKGTDTIASVNALADSDIDALIKEIHVNTTR